MIARTLIILANSLLLLQAAAQVTSVRTTLAGIPTASELGGIRSVTIDPVPMMECVPTAEPFSSLTSRPIQT